MKVILLIILSGLVTHSYAFSQNENEIMEKIGYLEFFIVENIILMGGLNCSAEISPEIRKAKKEAVDCIGDLSITGSFCESLKNDWMKCLRPLGKKLEKCNQNKILNGTIDASIRTSFAQANFICKSEGAHLFELVNPCVLQSLESEEPCVSKFVIDVQLAFIRTKQFTDEFCKASSELENCLSSTIEDNCLEITSNTVRGMYNASVESCWNK